MFCLEENCFLIPKFWIFFTPPVPWVCQSIFFLYVVGSKSFFFLPVMGSKSFFSLPVVGCKSVFLLPAVWSEYVIHQGNRTKAERRQIDIPWRVEKRLIYISRRAEGRLIWIPRQAERKQIDILSIPFSWGICIFPDLSKDTNDDYIQDPIESGRHGKNGQNGHNGCHGMV